MSAAVRPSTVEVVSQRTEKANGGNSFGAIPGITVFNEILDQHLSEGNNAEDLPPSEGSTSTEKPSGPSVDPWTILGISVPPLPHSEPITHWVPVRPDAPPSAAPIPETSAPIRPETDSELNGKQEQSPSPEQISTSLLKGLVPPPIQQNLPSLPGSKPEEIAEEVVEEPIKEHGIAAAKHPRMPQQMEKQNEISSREPLIRFDHPASEGPEIRSALALVATKGAGRISEGQETMETPPVGSFPIATPSLTQSTEPEQSVVPVRPLPVVDSIREQVQVLRGSHEKELRVVLRPDAQTELHLHLVKVDGHITLQARCERGNFGWLESQWSAIQGTLSNQGVRVESLQSPETSLNSQNHPSNSGSFSPPDQQGSSRERSKSQSNLIFDQDSPKRRQPDSRSAISSAPMRGWQSWA